MFVWVTLASNDNLFALINPCNKANVHTPININPEYINELDKKIVTKNLTFLQIQNR